MRVLFLILLFIGNDVAHGWSNSASSGTKQQQQQQRNAASTTRREILSDSMKAAFVGSLSSTILLPTRAVVAATASPEIFTTPNGIKYATTKKGTGKGSPIDKDIVAIEYTGYLTDGTIFDATHAEGKQKALVFELGGNAVIEGINEMVREMVVGQKVQAIIPPSLAFGDKGICIESGDCLVKPKSYLVYDIYLKRDAIPPP